MMTWCVLLRKIILLISLMLIIDYGNVLGADGVSVGYSFENNLKDRSGKGNDGVGQNIKYSSGKEGMAIELDGTASIRIPYSTDFYFRDKLSIEMWIYQTGNSLGSARLFETSGSTTRLWVTSNGLLYFEYNSESGGYEYLFSQTKNGGIFFNRWQYIAAIIGDGIMALYIDGNEVARKDIASSNRVIRVDVGDVYIGNVPGGTGFVGKIDEVRISKDISVNIPPLNARLTSYPSKEILKVTANTMGLYSKSGLRATAEIKALFIDRVIQTLELPQFVKGLSEGEFQVQSLEPGNYPITINLYDEKGKLLSKQTQEFLKLENRPWEGALERIVANTVPVPWSPVQFNNNTVTVWGRTYSFGSSSLFPTEIAAAGSSILSNPIRLIAKVGGDTVRWEDTRITLKQVTNPKVILETSARSINLEAKTVTSIEYDGMMKVEMTLSPMGGAMIDELILEIPIKPEHAQYFWNLPGNWSFQQPNAGRLPNGLWQKDFCNYIWIGDGERGLCWFAESQRNWNVHKDYNAVKIEKTDQGAVLRIYFVNTPLTLQSARTIVFGMQATPVKSRPKGWRKWLFGGGTQPNISIRWASPTYVRHYSFPVPNNLESFNSGIEEYHAQGQKFTTYSCYRYVSPSIPEREYYDGDWQIFGITGGVTNQSDVAQFYEPVIEACTIRKEYMDFYVYQYENYFKTTNADGIYIDGSSPGICQNPAHEECHYVDNNGQTKYDLHIFAAREAYKGLYTAAKKDDPDNIVVAHMSTTLYIPHLSFCDAIVDGEQYRSTAFNDDYVESFNPDIWIAEFSARQFGLVQFFLPEFSSTRESDPYRARGLIGLTLLHDIRLWLAYINTKEVEDTWKVLNQVGMEHTEFMPYWSNKNELLSSDKDVKVSAYYRQDREALLVIMNVSLAVKDVNISHDLSSVGLSLEQGLRVVDAYTNRVIPGSYNQFKVTVPGKDFRLIRIQSPDIFPPEAYFLSQNYPNPFNAKTTIKYSLPEKVHVKLSIYNVLGQEIKKLIDEIKAPGDYTIEWKGNDNRHLPVASGVYFYRFKAGTFVRNKKMVLIK